MAGKYLAKYRPAFMEASKEASGDTSKQPASTGIAA